MRKKKATIICFLQPAVVIAQVAAAKMEVGVAVVVVGCVAVEQRRQKHRQP
jgi:hypothetical protein